MFTDESCTQYASETSSDVYLRFNYPISMDIEIHSGANSINLTTNADGISIGLSIGEAAFAETLVDNINAGTVVHLSYQSSIIWDELPSVWYYNPYLWYVVDQDQTFVYFVLSDNDGQFKLPAADSGEYFAQEKATGNINTVEPDANGHIQRLSQCYDSMVVGNVTVENNTVLANGQGTSIMISGLAQAYYAVEDDCVGADNSIKNAMLPDGIYNIASIVINDSPVRLSFVIIGRIWHVVFYNYGNSNWPILIQSQANPVNNMNNGDLTKLRSANFAGLWGDDMSYDDEVTLAMAQEWLQSQLPASCIGQPIEFSDNGSSFNCQFSGFPEVFDIG